MYNRFTKVSIVTIAAATLLFLAGCQMAQQIAPMPISAKPTALVVGIVGESVADVYLIHTEIGGDVEDGRIVQSNYSHGNRFYILNAEPGDYMVVAIKGPGIAGPIDILDQKAAEQSRFTVKSGEVIYGGYVEITRSLYRRPFDTSAWRKKLIKSAAGSTLLINSSGPTLYADIHTSEKVMNRLKAIVAGDLGNTDWSRWTCSFSSCHNSEGWLSVKSPEQPSVTVTVIGCFKVTSVDIESDDGLLVFSGFNLPDEIHTPAAKLRVHGYCRLWDGAQTSIIDIDLGARKAGEKAYVCARVEKETFSSGRLRTSVKNDEEACLQFLDQ